MDGENVPVYEKATREYTIEPDHEGEMIVTVKCLNHQYDQKKIEVTDLDKDPPVVVTSSEEDGCINIFVSDDGTGVDWDGIYALDTASNKITPASYDKKSGRVSFTKPTNTINIYVPDKSGNILQLLLSV